MKNLSKTAIASAFLITFLASTTANAQGGGGENADPFYDTVQSVEIKKASLKSDVDDSDSAVNR